MNKKMLEATARTIQKYEQALVDLDNGADPYKVSEDVWDKCLLCEASKVKGWLECSTCMLGPAAVCTLLTWSLRGGPA